MSTHACLFQMLEVVDIIANIESFDMESCHYCHVYSYLPLLLFQVLEMGVGGGDGAAAVGEEAAAQGAEADPSSSGQPHTLVVEQVRILDMEGSLKAVYPARTDLQNDAFDVTRDYQ